MHSTHAKPRPLATYLRSTGTWAVAVSIFVHAALVYASGLIHVSSPPEPTRPRILTLAMVTDLPRPPPVEDLLPDLGVEPDTVVPPPEEPAPAPEPVPEKAPGSTSTRVEPTVELPSPVEPETRTGETPEEETAPSILDDREHTEAERAHLQVSDLEIATAIAIARARDRILHGPRLRTFSMADLFPEAPPDEGGSGTSIFDSPSVGRAGLENRNALGQTQRWVSDECFQSAGMPNSIFAFPAGRDIYAMAMTHCVGHEPRSDLFEEIDRDRIPDEPH